MAVYRKFIFAVLLIMTKSQIILLAEEMFSSMAALESLIEREQEVLPLLYSIRDREMEKLDAARQYVQRLRRTLHAHPSGNVAVTAHPAGAFHFIKDHAVGWASTKALTGSNHVTDFVAEIAALKTSRQFPQTVDLNGAASAFARLQKMYHLQARDIARGAIPAIRQTPSFSCGEAFLVGKLLAQQLNYGMASQWLEEAAELESQANEKKPAKSNSARVEILDWLQFSLWNHNKNASGALKVSEEIKDLDPCLENLNENIKRYRQHLANQSQIYDVAVPMASAGDGGYDALCRGQLKMVNQVVRNQRCKFETYNNPFLLLQPAKLEIVHVDPDITIVHDVLLNRDMKELRDLAKSKLTRAVVRSMQGAGAPGIISVVRVSQSAYLGEETFGSTVKTNNQRIGLLANLNVKYAENLQANNYGMGGMYLPHHDFGFGIKKQNLTVTNAPDYGDRIATFMTYLTDVEVGGATVFPMLNLTVFPQKGSALFWWNLHRDLEPDVRTLHSGCPVLAGSKWVATKWFREMNQDVTRPCLLRQDSTDLDRVSQIGNLLAEKPKNSFFAAPVKDVPRRSVFVNGSAQFSPLMFLDTRH